MSWWIVSNALDEDYDEYIQGVMDQGPHPDYQEPDE